jgi:RNA polymerase sigma-70 factor (ECF subfamily)
MTAHTDQEFSDAWTEHRVYLVDLAFRMLGNIQDAEDVVQDAFGRLLARDIDSIDDIRGWLVVVVSRLCLDQLRSARVRHEERHSDFDDELQTTSAPPAAIDPADRVTLDDSIRMALLVVLQQLAPAERAVFVLHDLFRFSFDAIATIVGRTPAACRQLASRARKHIEAESGPSRFQPDSAEQHMVARKFIAACAGGNLDALLELLDPDVVGDVDLGTGMRPRRPQRGRKRISAGILVFYGPKSGTTLVSQPVNGHAGLMAFRDQQLVGILQLKTRNGLIHDLHAIADPVKLAFVSAQIAVG